MIVTIHNYEAVLLDYFEGNLDADQELKLRDFLMAHPEIDVDLDNDFFQALPQEESNLTPPDFSFLKRSDFELPYDTEIQLAAYLEGDRNTLPHFDDHEQVIRVLNVLNQCKLTPGEAGFPYKKDLRVPTVVDMQDPTMRLIAMLEGDLDVPESDATVGLAAEWELVKKTKLQPPTLVYPDKKALYQTTVVSLYWTKVARAAIAAIFIGLVATIAFQYLNPTKSNKLLSHTGRHEINREVMLVEEAVSQPQQLLATVALATNNPVKPAEPIFQESNPKPIVVPIPRIHAASFANQHQRAAIALSSRGSANPVNKPGAMTKRGANTTEFIPLKELLAEKLKTGLLDQTQPESDTFVKALLNKASQKATGKLNAMKGVEVNIENQKNKPRIDIRIGKFSFRKG